MTTEAKRFAHVQGLALATMKLIDALKDGKPGDEMDDGQLGQTAGKPVAPQDSGYPNLMSAIRYVERVHQVVWRRVPKEGRIRCLVPGECVEVADSKRRHASRAIKSGSRTAAIALSKIAEIPEVDRPRAIAISAQLGFLASAASTATTKRIEAAKINQLPDLKQLFEQATK